MEATSTWTSFGSMVVLALVSGCGETTAGESRPPPVDTAATAEASAEATASATGAPSATPTAAPTVDPRRTEPLVDRWGEDVVWKGSLAEQNALMFEQLEQAHGITPEQRQKLEAIFAASDVLGQGNPEAAKHAASPKACRDLLAEKKIDYDDAASEAICGHRYMAPVYDPDRQKPEEASVCIDRFEFPNIPCVYPVTWVRASEAVAICQAMGKRLCDAHEWEGACYGKLTSVEESYNFGLIKKMKLEDAIKGMRAQQNINNHDDRRWAYGPKYHKGICATSSRKSKDCGVGWRNCGTNTFPAGMFPDCKSSFGVYDQHGNAAEHMNLPLSPDQLASSPEQTYGHTEMKGSWFVFDQVKAHEDHCRWRAPYWHGTRVMNPKSHRNYHLGFRCCASVKPR
ncbi:MAG: SUMF1/EgtB/PvdO family nonheme iron enzyme [Myxococcales bacterium]|nr:SUMF1/EgtB/PvdO family nonheme iron enzyme [Myxococcales bacterium]